MVLFIIPPYQYKQLLTTEQGLSRVSHSITTGTVPGAKSHFLLILYFINNGKGILEDCSI
jgi:hypothetical protein